MSEVAGGGGRVLDIPFAEAFLPLIGDFRFLGAEGGRGSAKSHFFADQLIGDVCREHQRVVCAREFQNSIAESSKQLLEDKIRVHGLSDGFRITDKEIVYPETDSLFVFRGLHGQTAQSAKSMEGFTRLWNEEAQTTSLRSLELVIPTFRAKGSKLMFSWNPDSPKDPVDAMFRQAMADKDPRYACVHVTYRDNPWFGLSDLMGDLETDRRRDPDKYAHVWLGKYRRLSQSRVFTNWTVRAFEAPADAVHRLGGDWGFAVDPTCAVRCHLSPDRKTLFVDYEAYKVGCRIEDIPALFDTIPGSRKWPFRADSARPDTIDYVRRHGYPRMEPADKGKNSVEDGVEFLKSVDIVIHPRCARTIDEMASYSYKVDKHTNEVLPVLEDKNNHVIDSLRYGLEGVRKSKNLTVSAEFAAQIKALTGGQRGSSLGVRFPR